jgi:phosphate:Na+ symporter
MFGMEQMAGSVKGLSQDPGFVSLLTMFKNPIIGVLAGTVVTAIIQSSSASVGILQAISLTGSLSYGAALPIIMGQNIGTCITAIISSVGANRNAKRVAAVHLTFNLIGTAVFLSLFYLLNAFLHFSFLNTPINAFGIAVLHSLFNLATTAMLYPFIGALERFARKLIPDDRRGELFVMLDDRLLNTPAIAIAQCRKQTMEMAVQSRDALLKADGLLDRFDRKVFEEVGKVESRIDQYEDKLGSYLVKISARALSAAESHEAFKLLHIIGDLERISDHAVNLGEAAEEMNSKRLSFSPEAHQDVAVMRRAVRDVLSLTVDALLKNSIDLAQRVEPLEEVVDTLRDTIKAGHIRRLQTGACTLEMGFVLSDVLNNLERVSDHCSNLAAGLIEIERGGNVDAHAYMKALRDGESGRHFQALYEEYLKQYPINSPQA